MLRFDSSLFFFFFFGPEAAICLRLPPHSSSLAVASAEVYSASLSLSAFSKFFQIPPAALLVPAVFLAYFAALSWTHRPICWIGFVLPSGIVVLLCQFHTTSSYNVLLFSEFQLNCNAWCMFSCSLVKRKRCCRMHPKVRSSHKQRHVWSEEPLIYMITSHTWTFFLLLPTLFITI